ncbi:hypothetical protein QR66_05165 [Chromobacterium piscinae]|nr:hypothetical protein QR66_05165 [Chromobacterium piscinae]
MQRYRPGHREDWELFLVEWCCFCERGHGQRGGQPQLSGEAGVCRILEAAYRLPATDPEYPAEWVSDPRQGPLCTAFVGEGEEVWPLDRDTRTLALFEGEDAA